MDGGDGGVDDVFAVVGVVPWYVEVMAMIVFGFIIASLRIANNEGGSGR